jgi:zinc transporter 1
MHRPVQLSESKNIASVHVLAARERDFMPIAAEIRKALHDQGIHPCTIQPEYYGARVAMEVSFSLRRTTLG